MIKHIFKIIWTERKINIWILFELILVFCVIWFCVDFISFYAKRYFEPRGFDISNVYHISLGIKEEGLQIMSSDDNSKKEELRDNLWIILDKIKQYSEVETACISQSAIPYSNSASSGGVYMDTLADYPMWKEVTPEFFEVYKINIEKGKVFEWDEITGENVAIISGDKDDLFFGKTVGQLYMQNLKAGNNDDSPVYKITGISQKTKKEEFESFDKIFYKPIKKSETGITYITNYEISVRVKSGSAKGFEKRFMKNMQQQLGIDPYYLSSVTSAEQAREFFMVINDYDNDFKNIASISTFLLINIFLGVIGTFWFRVQTRRSEIGLRLALGSTQTGVKKLFIFETLLLLFLASLAASVICINISLIDVLSSMDVPVIDREEYPVSTSQYITDYVFTFLILGIISIIAVWYPAKKASAIQPAVALKEE